jgi:hypothetical protein
MTRIDHLFFQADIDFIAYFDVQPLPGCDFGVEPCDCFARFIAQKAEAGKEIHPGLKVVEQILNDGGWNAQQLHRWFFPTLNESLKEEALRAQVEKQFGALSRAEWRRLQISENRKVI